MERLVQLQHQLNAPVYFSVNQGILTLAIQWKKDLFEASFAKGLSSVDDLTEFVEQLSFLEDLLEHMQQNVRIWGDKAIS